MSMEDFILPWEHHKHPGRATFTNSFAFLCSLALEEGRGTSQCPSPGWVQGFVAKADVSPAAGSCCRKGHSLLPAHFLHPTAGSLHTGLPLAVLKATAQAETALVQFIPGWFWGELCLGV